MKNFVCVYKNLVTGKIGVENVFAQNNVGAREKWDRFIAPYNKYSLIACGEANFLESEEEEEIVDEYTTDDLGPDWW